MSKHRHGSLDSDELKTLFTILSALGSQGDPFQYTVRLPAPLRGATNNAIKLRQCQACSAEFGGVVYHKRTSYCWKHERAYINKGRSRKPELK